MACLRVLRRGPRLSWAVLVGLIVLIMATEGRGVSRDANPRLQSFSASGQGVVAR